MASLNYLLTSHVWRQDHNGFSHQDPGFIDHVVNKRADVMRVYLPPDANTLLSVGDHCLRSRNYVNVVVAGKQPCLNWLAIHRPTYRRTNHKNFDVRGYKEEGTTTTPFDIVVMNDMDRDHLVMDVIDRVPGLGQRAARVNQHMQDKRMEHWVWPG